MAPLQVQRGKELHRRRPLFLHSCRYERLSSSTLQVINIETQGTRQYRMQTLYIFQPISFHLFIQLSDFANSARLAIRVLRDNKFRERSPRLTGCVDYLTCFSPGIRIVETGLYISQYNLLNDQDTCSQLSPKPNHAYTASTRRLQCP